jgi:hypothetical protein
MVCFVICSVVCFAVCFAVCVVEYKYKCQQVKFSVYFNLILESHPSQRPCVSSKHLAVAVALAVLEGREISHISNH